MSELQNEALEPVDNQTATQEIENPEAGSELAADSETQHEQKAETEQVIDNENVQKVINKKHFEAKEAERKAEEYKAKLAEYEAKQREEEARRYSNLPEAPDPFDDDYEQKLVNYNQALTEKAKFDARQEIYQQQQLQAQQIEQAKKAEEIQQKAKAYTSKAGELGISAEELQSAGNTIAQYGISDDLTLAILQDNEGPLITKYLASNPTEILDLGNMNPYMAGAKLMEIKQKAAQLKPKRTNAPEPATRLDGSTVNPDANKYPLTKGAKFE